MNKDYSKIKTYEIIERAREEKGIDFLGGIASGYVSQIKETYLHPSLKKPQVKSSSLLIRRVTETTNFGPYGSSSDIFVQDNDVIPILVNGNIKKAVLSKIEKEVVNIRKVGFGEFEIHADIWEEEVYE